MRISDWSSDVCSSDLGLVVAGDVADPADAARMVAASLEWLGGLDVLVNNIGIGAGAGPLHQVAEADIDRVLSVNLGTIYNMCRQTIPALMEGQGTAFVNLSSVAGLTRPGNPDHGPTQADVHQT